MVVNSSCRDNSKCRSAALLLVVCPPRLAAARRGVGARRSSSCLALEGPDANEDIDHFFDFAHAFRYENCQNWYKNWGPLGMLTFCIAFTLSKEDGLARTPPRGWRSWNTFGSNVTQAKMEAIMDAMVRRDRSVDGVPTSLCDLGYCDGMRVCHLSCRP